MESGQFMVNGTLVTPAAIAVKGMNISVTNNVVITTACWGIAFSSIHNGVIANNTVVTDGRIAAPGCVGANVSVGDKTHAGASSNNTVVRNNLTSQLEITTPASSVTTDHNVIILGNVSPELIWYVNGAVQYLGKPGTYANGNIIDSGGPNSEFVNFNPSTLTYNLMLKAGAPAIGAGTAAGAPTVDILGAARAAPYTASAYGYPR